MQRVNYGRMLTTEEVVLHLEQAVSQKTPLALVRVGDGENLVLAQEKVMKIKDVLQTRWGSLSRHTQRKGIFLPNLRAQHQLVKAIQRADIVGIPRYEDKEIKAPEKYLRPLTDQCFIAHEIHPLTVCHTFVNRHMVEQQEFWEMLRDRRVAIISRWAKPFQTFIDEHYENFHIKVVKTLPFSQYRQINSAIDEMKTVKCDVVLISAGVNAPILATQLKRKQGRVAIDFGKAPMYMVTNNTKRVQPWMGGDIQ